MANVKAAGRNVGSSRDVVEVEILGPIDYVICDCSVVLKLGPLCS